MRLDINLLKEMTKRRERGEDAKPYDVTIEPLARVKPVKRGSKTATTAFMEGQTYGVCRDVIAVLEARDILFEIHGLAGYISTSLTEEDLTYLARCNPPVFVRLNAPQHVVCE